MESLSPDFLAQIFHQAVSDFRANGLLLHFLVSGLVVGHGPGQLLLGVGGRPGCADLRRREGLAAYQFAIEPVDQEVDLLHPGLKGGRGQRRGLDLDLGEFAAFEVGLVR